VRSRPARGTLGKLFKDETLYNNANHMLEDSQSLLKAFRENPKKYLAIKLHIFESWAGLQFRNINGGAGENQGPSLGSG